MDITYIVHFLMLMSVPAISAALLYVDMRHGTHVSVAYGGIYAIIMFCFIMVDNSFRLVGKAVDKTLFNGCQTMTYVVRNDRSENALKLDEVRLKVAGMKVVDAQTEQRLCSKYSWNVIRYAKEEKKMQ